PDIDVGEVSPEQDRNDGSRQDHQPAHGGLALFGEQMARRAVLADRLALPLPDAQRLDQRRPEQEDEEERRDDRRPGPEGKIAEDVENREEVDEFLKEVEHRDVSALRSALHAMREVRLDRIDERSKANAVGPFDHNDISISKRVEN